jgi:hypothetical protein
MTDTEKLEKIARIVAIQTDNNNADDGDKYLSQAEYAMEAIEAVLGGYANGLLSQYEEAGA